MRSRMPLRLIMITFVAVALAVRPQATGSYKIKRAQAAAADVVLAEIQLDFDQDLHLLEFQDCPGVDGSCPPIDYSECPPCDYASVNECGTIRETRNKTDDNCLAQCDLSFCDNTTYSTWEEITLNTNRWAATGPTFGSDPPFVAFRLYVPEGTFCNHSIFARLTSLVSAHYNGDIFITRAPLTTSAIFSYSTFPSVAAGSDLFNGDTLHICPNDFSPVPGFYTDEAGPGTYFIYLLGPFAYNFSLQALPIAPPIPRQDMSWCTGIHKNLTMSLFDPNTLVQVPLNDSVLHCLENDRRYDFTASVRTRFVVRVEPGPCPQFFGISQADSQSPLDRELYASFTVPAFDQGDFSRFGQPAVLADLDFSKRHFAWSFCPANTSEPTYIYVTLIGPGPQHIFYSSNPTRFRATPFQDLGGPTELAYVAQSTITLRFPDGGVSPDCSGRCWFSNLRCACGRGFGPMIPYVEPSPLWPLPFWYTQIISRSNSPRASPEWLQEVEVDGRRRMFANILMSKTTTDNEGRVNAVTYFTEEQIAAMYVSFSGIASIVNAEFEAPLPDALNDVAPSTRLVRTPLQCTLDSYSRVRADLDKALKDLETDNQSVVITNFNLDSLNFRDAYIGCIDRADALINEASRTTLINSTECVQSSLDDPCCVWQEDWEVCCLPRPTNITTTTYGLRDDDSLQSECVDPSCLNTFLSDYVLAKDVSCGAALPSNSEWKFAECYGPHATCEAQVFGTNLVGVSCVTDADCGTNGYCGEPALAGHVISRGDPYATLNRPRGLRRVCRAPMATLVDQYLDCVLNYGSTTFQQYLNDFFPASSLAESIALLKTTYRNYDCLAPAGVATELDTGFFAKKAGSPSGSYCPQSTEIWSMRAYYSYFELDYWTEGPQDACGAFLDWYFPQQSQASCEYRLTCNWLDCVNEQLNNTNCEIACLAATSGVCALCRSDGTCFTDFSFYDPQVTDNTTCAAASACQLVNGSFVNLPEAECRQTFSCSHPCWNEASRTYEPCLTREACLQSGECDDELFTNMFTGEETSCLLRSPENPYYFPNCVFHYYPKLGDAFVVADTSGCVDWDRTTPQDCEDAGQLANAHAEWRSRAHTREECEAGCGCEKSGLAYQTPLRPSLTSPFPSTPEECAACTPTQECQQFHHWTSARWEAGDPRPLQWIEQPAMQQAYSWTESFDWLGYGNEVRYCEPQSAPFRRLAATAADCRFNRLGNALQAVACGCDTANNASACYNQLSSSPRIGIATFCPLVSARLIVPPHTIEYYRDSVQSAGCVPMSFFMAQRSNFLNAAPEQRLSTYFSPKRERKEREDYEFTNSRGAVIGQVIADGITINASEAIGHIRLCLSTGSFSQAIFSISQDEFVIFDFAIVAGTRRVQPLDLQVTVENDGYCATLTTFAQSTIVPVVRVPNWREKQEPGLTTGEKAVLAFVAAAYFVSALAYGPYYCIRFIAAHGWRMAVTISLFWLPILLGISNILRGIYFALLSSGRLSNSYTEFIPVIFISLFSSTYVDVLLVELPTFVWFTATTLMVLFWVVLLASLWTDSGSPRIRRLKRAFWIVFAVVNIIMYCLFITFVVVFSQLDDSVEKQQCGGRLPDHTIRRPRRIAFIVYQSFLAGITVLLALAYFVGGILLSRKLRAVKLEDENRRNAKNLWKLVTVACFVAAAVALHAIFIFLLAITDPGIPYLALILLALDVGPSVVLLWSLPSPQTGLSTSSSNHSQGIRSRRSVISDL